MKIAPIIVSYNEDVEVIKSCLNSFSFFEEVYFVNNGLNEDISEVVSEFENVNEIIPEYNLGYSKAINLAYKNVEDADYVLIANADLWFEEGEFRAFAEKAQELDAGVAGLRLLTADGEDQVPVRRFPTLLDLLVTLFKFSHVIPSLTKNYYYNDLDLTSNSKVDTVMGAFMLIKNDLFDLVNGFDDGYFLWYEEIDFQKKVAESGGSTWYLGEFKAYHLRGHSFNKILTLQKQAWLRDSVLHYSKKWLPVWQNTVLIILYPAYYAAGIVTSLIKK